MIESADGSKHDLKILRVMAGDTQVFCYCGAKWTHPAKVTDDQIRDVFESHCKYFTRPKTLVL